MQTLFQIHPINLSIAVWIGFLALFGIASDDGVVIATFLKQSFEKRLPGTVSEVREAVVEAGKRRCRFHGGMSTGPKTTEGRARIAEAQRRHWAR